MHGHDAKSPRAFSKAMITDASDRLLAVRSSTPITAQETTAGTAAPATDLRERLEKPAGALTSGPGHRDDEGPVDAVVAAHGMTSVAYRLTDRQANLQEEGE